MKIKYLLVAGILFLYSCASTHNNQEITQDSDLIWQSSSVSVGTGAQSVFSVDNPDTPQIPGPSFISELPEHFLLYFRKGILLLPEPSPPPESVAESHPLSDPVTVMPEKQPSLSSSSDTVIPADSNKFTAADLLAVFPREAYKSYLPEDVVIGNETEQQINTTAHKSGTRPSLVAREIPETSQADQISLPDNRSRVSSALAKIQDNSAKTETVQWHLNSDASLVLPGRNWYFISADNPSLLTFEKRFLDDNNTIFRFFPRKEGSVRLFFRRQDLLNDNQEEKYIDVSVGPELVQHTPQTIEKKHSENELSSTVKSTADEAGSAKSSVEPKLVIPENFDLAGYYGMTKPEVIEIIASYTEAGLIGNAIALASFALTELFPEEFNDDLLWILAQLHELEGPEKDLRMAIVYYGQLVERYPFSIHFKEAQGRAGYLERFHIYYK